MAVLPVVDEHALALLLQPLRRDLARVALLEQPRRLLREVVGLLERRPARDRRDDVDAVGAARLHVARQLELVEQLADQVRDLDRQLEAVVRRVEVEEDEVRTVGLVDARVPRVHVDAVVLHHEQHGFGSSSRVRSRRAASRLRVATCGTAASGSSSAGASAPASGRTTSPRDPVRLALHRERPVAQVRHDRRRRPARSSRRGRPW